MLFPAGLDRYYPPVYNRVQKGNGVFGFSQGRLFSLDRTGQKKQTGGKQQKGSGE